jgi:predicted ATPase
VLLERDREVQLLTGLLAGADTGGHVVLIRGEAGVGKTSLVREFIERIGDEAHILVGTCDDLSTPQPLSPFYDIARTEPDIAQALGAQDRRSLFDATLELLSRRLRPTVLVIEDTQWAGEATLDAIRFLGRRIHDTNSLLILTYRDEADDLDHPLRAALGAIAIADMTRIHLECLSAEAVAALLEGTGHDLPTVMRLTDGNPLYVAEIAASASGTSKKASASST